MNDVTIFLHFVNVFAMKKNLDELSFSPSSIKSMTFLTINCKTCAMHLNGSIFEETFKEFKQLRMLPALSDRTLIILSSTLNSSKIFSRATFKLSASWRPLRYANP